MLVVRQTNNTKLLHFFMVSCIDLLAFDFWKNFVSSLRNYRNNKQIKCNILHQNISISNIENLVPCAGHLGSFENLVKSYRLGKHKLNSQRMATNGTYCVETGWNWVIICNAILAILTMGYRTKTTRCWIVNFWQDTRCDRICGTSLIQKNWCHTFTSWPIVIKFGENVTDHQELNGRSDGRPVVSWLASQQLAA